MIKINLLPFRAARKRENIKRQITLYVVVVILTLTVLGLLFKHLNDEVSNLKKEEERMRAELATYQKELDEIKSLEKKINEIKTKLDVIKTLEKGKTGPVLLLADISEAVPKDKLWLTSLTEKSGSLTLTGTAMDNETIAVFMDNLEMAERVTFVDLESSTLKELKEYNLEVYDFIIKCETYAHE